MMYIYQYQAGIVNDKSLLYHISWRNICLYVCNYTEVDYTNYHMLNFFIYASNTPILDIPCLYCNNTEHTKIRHDKYTL